MKTIEQLVQRLYDARQAAAKAKKSMREAGARLGNCACYSGSVLDMRTTCYHDSLLPKEKWCDICKEKLPIWVDYHNRANAAGAALRMVLDWAKKKGKP
jgi:hypothetical protein